MPRKLVMLLGESPAIEADKELDEARCCEAGEGKLGCWCWWIGSLVRSSLFSTFRLAFVVGSALSLEFEHGDDADADDDEWFSEDAGKVSLEHSDGSAPISPSADIRERFFAGEVEGWEESERWCFSEKSLAVEEESGA